MLLIVPTFLYKFLTFEGTLGSVNLKMQGLQPRRSRRSHLWEEKKSSLNGTQCIFMQIDKIILFDLVFLLGHLEI